MPKTLKEILEAGRDATQIVTDLKQKTIEVIPWSTLEKEYNPKKHPVMTDATYNSKTDRKGKERKVTRVILPWQKLAVRRMGALAFGIPVKRVYKPKDDRQKKASAILESIYKRNHINSVNLERSKFLYASCEVVTIWYTQNVEGGAAYAGERAPYKLRCKNYSPMKGDQLYPLFDEYDDMIALSVEYTRKEGTVSVTYFDTYTQTSTTAGRPAARNGLRICPRSLSRLARLTVCTATASSLCGKSRARMCSRLNGRTATTVTTCARTHAPTG